MGASSRNLAIFRRLLAAAGLAAVCLAVDPSRVCAEISIAGSALLAGDEWGYRQEQYGVDVAHEAETAGQSLALRFHRYALSEELEGIFPFSGSEPAARANAHVLLGLWWLSASAGLQGTLDFEGVTGELIVARAIAAGAHTFTPRVELAREPLSLTPLPMSLGLHSHRAQAALMWRTDEVVAEAGGRFDFWEGDVVEGRVRNSARDRIGLNRISTGYAYLLSDSDGWLDAGLSAKVTAAEHNTLLATQLAPERRYTWYPASAPVFAWETSAVLQAHGPLGDALELALKLSLPLLSQETRQWESVRRTSWGSAPYEGQLDVAWHVLSDTSLQLQAKLFIKPWESWDAIGDGAYRHASVRVTLEQRI
jgi:hypothetical protein